MTNDLSKREQEDLKKTDRLSLSVTIDHNNPSTHLYQLEDGQPRDALNTIRANSPLHAIRKINRRYIIHSNRLHFKLTTAQRRAAWHNARQTAATNKPSNYQEAETYWTERSRQHQERFNNFTKKWPRAQTWSPPENNDNTPIDVSRITFEDPPDWDIEDNQ